MEILKVEYKYLKIVLEWKYLVPFHRWLEEILSPELTCRWLKPDVHVDVVEVMFTWCWKAFSKWECVYIHSGLLQLSSSHLGHLLTNLIQRNGKEKSVTVKQIPLFNFEIFRRMNKKWAKIFSFWIVHSKSSQKIRVESRSGGWGM